MAFQTIGTYRVYEFEQEEIVDKQLIAGDDGVVNEVETLIQEYAHVWADLIIQQETIPDENRSNFKAELWLYATAGERGDGFSLNVYRGGGNNSSYVEIIGNSMRCYNYYSSNLSLNVAAGETKSQVVCVVDPSSSSFQGYDIGYIDLIPALYHEIDGRLTEFRFCGRKSYDYPKSMPLSNIRARLGLHLNNLLTNGENKSNTILSEDIYASFTPLSIDRATYPLTANNFTDEENPSFTYATKTSYNFVNSPIDYSWDGYYEDVVTSLQVALSFDGETADIDYRDIPIDGTSYTFNLTETERELLRVKAQGSDIVPIYYLTKTVRETVKVDEYHPLQTATFIGATQRNLTIVGCNPSLNPTVKDIKPETLALTGDENTFVRYESMAEFAINATASKHAEIVSQSVTCGSKTISNLPYGVIDDVESGTFIFNVTDSRSMGASSSVFKNLIEYVKPTCYQKEEIEITGETGATIKLKVNGSYFNGSFGAADNTLKLEVRYTDGNNNWEEWQTISGTPTFNGTTYELETRLTGFDYGKAYIFQCRATDKLNIVQSSQYTIRMLPVFDWSENDFNFNVPVNIDAEDLSMHGETIIRHSNTTNNTVLSASSGNIYIRPGGTDNTYNETIFYGNGNVKFNGTVTFADGSTAGGAKEYADYIIATGEEAMGSNGTWYWRKWNSGKAEAWGCRNFGNMAVTTTWGNLYRGAILTQDLPNNVFIRTPDAININIVHSNYGGWICKHEQTAPSADTTGSFIFVRPASATVTPTNIGFYIAGEWK